MRPSDGLIPAHAGKTWTQPRRPRYQPAHPRSRGENVQGRSADWVQRGSSPLTRGKPPRPPRPANRCGLIPAHAGKTSVMTTHGGASRAHPRSRGEHVLVNGNVSGPIGSSPLTREKPQATRFDQRTARLIPAHAGKTGSGGPRNRRGATHPRSRRENELAYQIGELYWGSSPLTRGKPVDLHEREANLRLIPTHAGRTPGTRPRSQSASAYPHTRGENLSSGWQPLNSPGPSPLTQGKTPPRNCGRGVGWLIPADQGKLIYINEIHVATCKAPNAQGGNISPTSNPSSHQSHSTFLHKADIRTHGRANVIKPQPYALPRPIPLTRA